MPHSVSRKWRPPLWLVLGHLAQNAAHAEAVRLVFAVQTTPDGPVLTVADDGPGISAGNRARVFEPFFTIGRASGGTGMGLGIARAVMEAHGHEISLLPDAPGDHPGARFRLAFAG